MSEKLSEQIIQNKKSSPLSRKYDDNPFVTEGGFRVPLKRKSERIETHGPLKVSAGEESIAVAEIRKVTSVDSDRFVKIFTENLDRFFNLTPTALRIVTVLLHNIGNVRVGDGDKVYLNESEIGKRFVDAGMKKLSQATYFRAINELIEKGFIAPSTQHPLFFINPAIFFNGDRVRFVTEIRKRKRTKQDDLESAGQTRLELDPYPQTGEIKAVGHDDSLEDLMSELDNIKTSPGGFA